MLYTTSFYINSAQYSQIKLYVCVCVCVCVREISSHMRKQMLTPYSLVCEQS